MFKLLTIVVFVWLMVKATQLAFRLTWGAAKIIASILMVIALTLLAVCFLFVGGIALLVPVIVISIAVAILKACV